MSDVKPVMDASEWLVKMAYAKALEKRAAELRAELKAHAPEDLAKGTAQLPSGSAVAVITRKAGYTRYTVTDKSAFRDYVATHHPDMVELAVRDDFKKHLLGMARHQVIPGTKGTTVAPTFEVDLSEDAFDDFWLEQAENVDFAAMLDLA